MSENMYRIDTDKVYDVQASTRGGRSMSYYQVKQDLVNRLESEGIPYVIVEPKREVL